MQRNFDVRQFWLVSGTFLRNTSQERVPLFQLLEALQYKFEIRIMPQKVNWNDFERFLRKLNIYCLHKFVSPMVKWISLELFIYSLPLCFCETIERKANTKWFISSTLWNKKYSSYACFVWKRNGCFSKNCTGIKFLAVYRKKSDVSQLHFATFQITLYFW